MMPTDDVEGAPKAPPRVVDEPSVVVSDELREEQTTVPGAVESPPTEALARPAAKASEPPPVSPSRPPPAAPPISSSRPPPPDGPTTGPILVQRTIAIGVGAPTHTTTARERESIPPPSDPMVELSDSEMPSRDIEVETEPASEAPAPAPAEDREELLDELEVLPDQAKAKRSSPPPPPAVPLAAAPPPPPRDRPPPPPKAPPAPAAAPPPAPAPAAEVDTGKRTRRKWWEEFFNDDYFRTVPPPQPRTIAAQSAFIAARLGLRPGASILDVGCGLGLHAIELTRLGYVVVGLDLSLPMLTRAADEAQDQGLKINFVQGDMREMAFESLFDAVLCWGTTFGYFDDDQNRLVVERLHRALKPGGLLLLDVVNRDYVFKTQPNNVWFQGDGCIVMEESNANFINSRLTVKRQVMLDDGRQSETVYSVRLYSLHELGQILHQRGFRVVEVSGREATPGVFFGGESPRLIITAERRPDQAKRADGEPLGAGDSQQLPAMKD
jgi:2-polyprenyl-3-methyl-5-hydroxy-6-metoxy-1,4-benzoquinol methylase